MPSDLAAFPDRDDRADPTGRAHRRQARVLAMQALCQWEVQPDDREARLAEFVAEQKPSSPAAEYAVKLVGFLWREQATVDAQIASASTRWDFSRISPVERNIMRVAVVELTTGEAPPKVALNEAIEIGQEFGGAESPRFINGVLDEVLKSLPVPDSRE